MALPGRKLKDITEEFTIAAHQLKPGELVKDDFFTLFEAVGALEIMDPKMDSGYVPPDDTLEPDFDPSTALTANEVIWIMDQLLCLEISWLDGYPLSQTIFTSLHIDRLLSPDKTNYDTFRNDNGSEQRPIPVQEDPLVHRVLRAYCIALIKSCQLALHLIQSQTYSEEEDFVSHLFARELMPTLGSTAAHEMLEDAMGWIGEAGIPAEASQALIERCRFRQYLMETLAGDAAHQWDAVLGQLELIKESQPLGKAVPEAFSEKVQRQLASSTPPRPMIQRSFDESYPIWTTLCHDIMAAYQLTSPKVVQSPYCLQRAVWYFAYTRQPITLARAQMQELLFANNAVRDQMPHFDLMLADMSDLGLAGDPLVDPESFQIEAPNDPRHKCSNLMRGFMEKVIDEYLNLYRMVCQNRCRTRRTFTQAIAIWDAIQKEANEVDQGLLQYSKTLKNEGFTRSNGPLLTWARHHTLRILAWTIQLGFETDIYLPDELGKMYWYLAAFSAYRTNLLETMLDGVRQRKKTLRDGRKAAECLSSQTFLASLIDSSQATRSLADALWKFHHLLSHLDILRSPKRDFAHPDLLHEARMKAYLALPHGYAGDDIPSAGDYEAEMQDLEHTVFETFESTCAVIEGDVRMAKAALTRVKKFSAEQGRFVGTEEEWKKEVKGMETSCVAVAVGVSQLKRWREKLGTSERLGEVVGCACEKKYHEWWVVPQLREKGG